MMTYIKRLLSMFLVLCLSLSLVGSAVLAEGVAYKAGTYTAKGQGMGGDVEVSVTFTEDAITEVVVGEHSETAGISDAAIAKIPEEIIAGQTLMVDVVTGATMTSNAILAAVEDCVVQAGGDAGALKVAKEVEVTKGEDQTVDVVIVGAGLAGIMAAYELKENHPELSYLVLEKLDITGGSLPTTGGAIIATDAKTFVEGNFASTTEDITEMFKRTSDADIRGQLVDNVFAGSGKLLDKLIDWDVVFKYPPTLSSNKYSDKVYALWAENSGAGFNQGLQAHISHDGINVVTGAKATELIVEDGAVTGVSVETKDSIYQVRAKAVLLATGGFGSSPEHVAEFAPKYKESIVSANAGATGDGFDMTKQFGTKVVGDGVMGSPRNESGQGVLASTFIVNAKGERFIDETQPGYAIIRAMGDGDGFAYMLADADYQDQEALKARELVAYDSLEALADAFSFDKAAFLAGVEKYNKAVDEGKDPELGLPVANAQKLDNAPFYAEKIVLRYFGTIPGIEISDEFEVLSGDGAAVKGLYAAGELTAGNAFTRQYPGGGVGISYAANSGRAAAEKIAADLK